MHGFPRYCRANMNRIHHDKFPMFRQTHRPVDCCGLFIVINQWESVLTRWEWLGLVGGFILVSWGYYSQHMESHKIPVPNHQPGDMEFHIPLGRRNFTGPFWDRRLFSSDKLLKGCSCKNLGASRKLDRGSSTLQKTMRFSSWKMCWKIYISIYI